MEQSKTKIHDGHRDRVRAKVKNGIDGFHDHEILEYLLFAGIPRRDVNDLAHTLIDTFGGFSEVLDASFDELKSVAGMTENAALMLSTLPYVFERYQFCKNKERDVISSRRDIIEYAKMKIGNRTTELFLVICLDIRKKLIRCIEFQNKSRTQVFAEVKDVVAEALKAGAHYVATAHNHPSGDVNPSVNDVYMCRELAKAFVTVGIIYVDNVIVGAKDDMSFVDEYQKKGDTVIMKEPLFNFDGFDDEPS